MRITNRMMTDNAIRHMAEGLEKVNKYSEQVATGKKFQVASDDPVTASLVMQLKSTLKTSEAYRNTTQLTDDWMSASDFALDKMETSGYTAVNRILQGLNDTLASPDFEERKVLATEIDGILNHLVQVGNSTHNGQYIFGGYQTDQPPFVYNPSVNPDLVTYQGDSNKMMRTLGPDQTLAMNIPGEDAATGRSVFVELFQNLMSARNQLNGAPDVFTPPLPVPIPPDFTDAFHYNLRNTMNALKSNMEELGSLRTSNGARQRQVLSAADYLDKVDIEVKGLLNQKESANVAEAISNMRGQETVYQTVLEVSQRSISALNLFDYLQ